MMMTAIGGLLMGLGGSADKFIEMIQQDREHAQEERDVSLKESRGRLDDFRSRTMSPQAAAQFEDALKARIVAEDIRIMAAESGSVESQVAGEQAAAQLERQAALWEADAKQREAGAIAEKVAVIPRQVVGGGGGGLPGAMKRIKMLIDSKAVTEEQGNEMMRQLVRGQGVRLGDPNPNAKMTPSDALKREQDERERIVKLPDGRRVFATNASTAKELQGTIRSADTFIKQGSLLKDLTTQAGSRSWGAQDTARAQSVLTDMAAVYKEMKKLGTYDDGVAKLIDDGVGDPTAFFRNPGAVAKVQQAMDNAKQDITQVISYDLYEDPSATRPAAATDTELGFVPEGQ
jgi:hypothetical protein